jgi:CheY-like chemotaxis protein
MIDGVEVLVLVADDNDGIRDTTAAILRSVGYTVTDAQDGEAALAELNQKPFDVCVLDVRMPKRDGISVVKSIAPEPAPPVIVMLRRMTSTPALTHQKPPRSPIRCLN